MKIKNSEGIPICKNCQKTTENPRIIVKQNSLEDYYLCASCYFFKTQSGKEIVIQADKNLIKEISYEQYIVLKCQARFNAISKINSITTLARIRDTEKTPSTRKKAEKRFIRITKKL